MESGGSAHSLVIKVLVMSHKERVGDRMKHRDKEKLESRVRKVGWGGLLTLLPGVPSHCQEADIFLSSDHESAYSVLVCQGPTYPFICSTCSFRTGTVSNLNLHSGQRSNQQTSCNEYYVAI